MLRSTRTRSSARSARSSWVGISGFETPVAVRGDALTFTVLRDPFDRIRSTYGHFHTRKKGNPLGHKVPRMSLEDYLKSNDPEILQWTDNVIARQLARSHDRDRVLGLPLDTMVEQAIAHINQIDVVAFVDQLPRDMVCGQLRKPAFVLTASWHKKRSPAGILRTKHPRRLSRRSTRTLRRSRWSEFEEISRSSTMRARRPVWRLHVGTEGQASWIEARTDNATTPSSLRRSAKLPSSHPP